MNKFKCPHCEKMCLSTNCSNFMSKGEIIDKHTNHDRMSKIFSMVGLNKISKILLDSKGR